MMKKKVIFLKFAHRGLKKLPCTAFALLMAGVFMSMSRVFADTRELAAVKQQITVTGTVTDNAGEPLPGVNVVVKGTTTGVIAGIDGRYSISVPGTNSVLQFSFVGYVTQEVTVEEQLIINITLSEDAQKLEEVVVMGYYSQNIRNVSASVSKVNMNALDGTSQASITSLLAGQAPGIQTVMRTGTPGMAGSGIVIRGNTSLSANDGIQGLSNPLYVVDGIPMSLQDLAGFDVSQNDFLSTLNVDEIASINILKDAAATALYGAQGANGVIVITTKRGTSGKARITGRATFGIVAKPPRLDVYIGQAEREAKIDLINKGLSVFFGDREWFDIRTGSNGGKEILGYALPAVLTDKYNPAFNNAYDYQDLFYQRGFSQEYSLSMEGGNDDVANYRVGLGYRDEKGAVVGYGHKRFTMNASLRNRVGRLVTNDIVLSYTNSERNGGYGEVGQNNYLRGIPTSPVELPTSLFYRTPEELRRLSGILDDGFNKNSSHNLRASETLRINFTERLSWDNFGAVSILYSTNDCYIPATARSDNRSYGQAQNSLQVGLTGRSQVTYRYELNDHQFFAFAGAELKSDRRQMSYIFAEDGSSDYLQVIQGFKKEDIGGYSDVVKTGMLSYYGRIEYGYMDNRYNVSATLRRDGSSEFGANNKWATFPSATVYWAFSKEPWMASAGNWLSFGKIRVSYGQTGSLPGDPLLQYNRLMATNNIGAGVADISVNRMDVKTYGGQTMVVSDFGRVPNKSLSWVKSKEINYGLDLELFNYRLFVNSDVYSKYISGDIFPSSLPPYLGYTNISSNLVDMIENGFELGITGYLFPRTSKFQWDWTVNFARSQTLIARLGNGGRDYIRNDYAFVVGRPAFQYFMWEYAGVLQSVDDLPVNPLTGQALRNDGDMGLGLNLQGSYFPGMALFTDVNGDYRITNWDNNDKKIIDNKSPEPKIRGGLHTTLRYAGFSLRIQSSFAFGHHIYNSILQQQLQTLDDATLFFSRALYKFDDNMFWEKPGDNAYYPMLWVSYSDGGSNRNFRTSSMFLEKGDYWSIDNVTLSYSFPQKWTSAVNMRGVNVYATVHDLYMWKKSKVFDPRLVGKTGWSAGQAYPISTSFVFGVQFQF